MASKENGIWRTVGGRRIFIVEGQSLSDAMKKSGKFNTTKSKSNFYQDLSESKKKNYDTAMKTLSQLIDKGYDNWIEQHEHPMSYFGDKIAPVMRELQKKDNVAFNKIDSADKAFWNAYNSNKSSKNDLVKKAKKLKDEWEKVMK